ncbi:hypothetical protein [Sinomonas cyclohexanicum]|uniref:hypothetical protein n=1 Tax=Sinomonas cyclohexanicum TaxID=322009 RepID=UPI001E3FE498|nr:hypothetical protein [Corynebacterium cyclohexanicum]
MGDPITVDYGGQRIEVTVSDLKYLKQGKSGSGVLFNVSLRNLSDQPYRLKYGEFMAANLLSGGGPLSFDDRHPILPLPGFDFTQYGKPLPYVGVVGPMQTVSGLVWLEGPSGDDKTDILYMPGANADYSTKNAQGTYTPDDFSVYAVWPA